MISIDYLTLLLFLSFILLMCTIKISQNLLSPSSIFMFVFVFSISCAYYSKDLWGFVMAPETFYILVIGMLTFLMISFIVNQKKPKKNFNYKLKEIRVSSLKIIILYIIYLIFSMIYLYYICKVSNTYNIMQAGAAYRNLSRDLTVQVPAIARLSILILRVMTTVICCIIMNNFYTKAFKRNKGYHLVCLLLIYVILTILSGERTSFLRIMGVIVLSFSVYYQRANKFKKLGSMKMIIGLSACALLLLLLFSYIRHFVGRSSQLDFLDYISFYAGGPIYNFDRSIRNFVVPTFDGNFTFLGLSNNLARFGIGSVRSVHRQVVTIPSKKIFLGNVYTCFYDYYMDFGIVGMVVLTGIYSFFVNRLYVNAKYSTNNSFIKSILYLYFGTTVFFVSFTEQFYSSYIAISTFESLLVIVIMVFFLSAKRINKTNIKCRLF